MKTRRFITTTMLLIVISLVVSTTANAQIKALTENGKEVLLFENGTWKYAGAAAATDLPKDTLKTNPRKFEKSPTASFLVKSNRTNVGVYMDPAKWTFQPGKENQAALEYSFVMKTADAYAMLITEKMEVSFELLRSAALINARKASLDATEESAEYRIVNGKKVLCLRINGTIQGLKFMYYGYYYSSSKGTTQLIGYTSQNLFADKQKDIETFLSGLVELNK